MGVGEMTRLLIDGRNCLYRSAARAAGLADGVDRFVREIDSAGTYIELETGVWPEVTVVWEGNGSREHMRSIYPDYKASREANPRREALRAQVDDLEDAVRCLLDLSGHTQAYMDAREADAVLVALASEGEGAWVLSTDADLRSALRPGVALLRPGQGGLAEVTLSDHRAEFGPVKRWPEIRALAGDRSDGWAGVPRVGPKRAVKLLEAHGDLESVLRAARGREDAPYTDIGKLEADILVWRTIASPMPCLSIALDRGASDPAQVTAELAAMGAGGALLASVTRRPEVWGL